MARKSTPSFPDKLSSEELPLLRLTFGSNEEDTGHHLSVVGLVYLESFMTLSSPTL